MMTTNLAIFAVLAVLQIADVCTTWFIIRCGIGHEGNPLVAGAIRSLGLLPGLVLPKVLVMVLVYASARQPLAIPFADYLQTAILAALLLWYLRVVLGNLLIILAHR